MFKILEFTAIGDERGSLIALEGQKNIPFDIKRVYYIFDNVSGVERGFHAHKNLKQVAVCIHGSCTFVLDDGKVRKEVVLDDKSTGLYIEGLIWREMKNFSPGAVLIVFASEHYDEKDYIRNREEFLELARKGDV